MFRPSLWTLFLTITWLFTFTVLAPMHAIRSNMSLSIIFSSQTYKLSTDVTCTCSIAFTRMNSSMIISIGTHLIGMTTRTTYSTSTVCRSLKRRLLFADNVTSLTTYQTMYILKHGLITWFWHHWTILLINQYKYNHIRFVKSRWTINARRRNLMFRAILCVMTLLVTAMDE